MASQYYRDPITGKLVKMSGFGGGNSGSGGASSWNDLTDKPFGESDNAVLLPPTQLVGGLMTGAFVGLGILVEFMEGKTYTVNWNGVDYETQCFIGQFNGENIPMLGNPMAVGGDNNNLPFTIGGDEQGLAAVPLDGSTTVNVGISGYVLKKIPAQYLPVVRSDICVSQDEFNGNSELKMSYDTTELVDTILSGGDIYVHMKSTGYIVLCMRVNLIAVYWGSEDCSTLEDSIRAYVAKNGKQSVPLLIMASDNTGFIYSIAMNIND